MYICTVWFSVLMFCKAWHLPQRPPKTEGDRRTSDHIHITYLELAYCHIKTIFQNKKIITMMLIFCPPDEMYKLTVATREQWTWHLITNSTCTWFLNLVFFIKMLYTFRSESDQQQQGFRKKTRPPIHYNRWPNISYGVCLYIYIQCSE